VSRRPDNNVLFGSEQPLVLIFILATLNDWVFACLTCFTTITYRTLLAATRTDARPHGSETLPPAANVKQSVFIGSEKLAFTACSLGNHLPGPRHS
jgi:hypothetical protein